MTGCALWFASVCLIEPSSFSISAELSQPLNHDIAYGEGMRCTNGDGTAHWCRGPKVDLSLGMTIEFSPRFTADYGIKHTSYLAEHDRGVESVFVRVVWRPMAK
jgi:hypothetical protein